MNPNDFPAPSEGFVLTYFLVVSDQDRSRRFYQTIFDGLVVTLTTPPDPDRTSTFLNVRVADIWKTYRDWSAKGATFLTEPKDHDREIRAYIRDPDGHLIEVGQSVGTREAA